jgi:hypothetical protein
MRVTVDSACGVYKSSSKRDLDGLVFHSLKIDEGEYDHASQRRDV